MIVLKTLSPNASSLAGFSRRGPRRGARRAAAPPSAARVATGLARGRDSGRRPWEPGRAASQVARYCFTSPAVASETLAKKRHREEGSPRAPLAVDRARPVRAGSNGGRGLGPGRDAADAPRHAPRAPDPDPRPPALTSPGVPQYPAADSPPVRVPHASQDAQLPPRLPQRLRLPRSRPAPGPALQLPPGPQLPAWRAGARAVASQGHAPATPRPPPRSSQAAPVRSCGPPGMS